MGRLHSLDITGAEPESMLAKYLISYRMLGKEVYKITIQGNCWNFLQKDKHGCIVSID